MGLSKAYLLVLSLAFCLYCFPRVILGSAISVDGFNLYKDLLRGKNDEFNEISDDENGIARVIYFYRTPAATYTEFAKEFDAEGLGKRSSKYRNFMLNREGQDDPEDIVNPSKFYFPRTMPKRGALLSWAIPAANRPRRQLELSPARDKQARCSRVMTSCKNTTMQRKTQTATNLDNEAR
ncbi:uncharacterized protein LOC132257208 [Phlebotomus argentipes]|uniref:uncharacterized protein LOC132257208 n=1 Tax=Phlebotomus argentipes TaxID=94469 RepID=UPI0028933554|nr:uncharacterized protein LOC132257208 [Phlebotomus argentipes]